MRLMIFNVFQSNNASLHQTLLFSNMSTQSDYYSSCNTQHGGAPPKEKMQKKGVDGFLNVLNSFENQSFSLSKVPSREMRRDAASCAMVTGPAQATLSLSGTASCDF